jgi:nucleoside-diphosphate-sugar epimerase
MKIIITGALGHIGSKLIRELSINFEGCEILMLDNLASQRLPSLFELPKSGNYRFIQCDVAKDKISNYIEGASVVIHLAALTDAAGSFDRADEIEKINFSATQNVSKACIEMNIPMIMASSTSVYGTQNEIVDEFCSTEDLKPQSPYAESKLKEESLIKDMVEKENLKAIIFRFGTIFGVSAGMRFHTAVNKFCWQAVMGQKLTVWETALDQKRPYLHLDDCVGAISFAIRENLFDGQIYNVVSKNCSVRDVIDTIKDYIPDLEIKLVEHKIMNQLSYEVLSSRLEEKGFTSKNELRSGIHDTISMLQNSNNANSH